MLTWSWVCTRFTEDHRQKLRTVRLGLPTPPELTGTIALSYCEQALQQVYQRFDRLMRVVKHDAKSFELSGQESMAFHADQIVRQFDEAVDGWPYTDFTRDTAEEYDRLIELELQLFFGDGSRVRGAPPSAWKQQRKDHGIRVFEQLGTLYTNDERYKGMTAAKLAEILGCDPTSIRPLQLYKQVTADAEHRRRTGRI